MTTIFTYIQSMAYAFFFREASQARMLSGIWTIS